METKTYKNEEIIAYLLGSLPEAETEAFDELSFTDDDFNDQLTVVEKDLVDAYIQGELTDKTLAKFESYYLASPLRREKVEFAKALQVFTKTELAKASRETEEEQSKIGFFTFVSNLFSGHKMQLGFAVAALLLLIFSGFWIFINRSGQPEVVTVKTPPPISTSPKNENISNGDQISSAVNIGNNSSSAPTPENRNAVIVQNTPSPKPTPTPLPSPSVNPTAAKPIIASFILTPPLRGSGNVQTISLSKQTTAVSVQLQLETDDYSAYQVVLINQSGKNLRQSGKLRTKNQGENKVLGLSFPAQLLKDGFYSLSVSGIKEDGTKEIISNYSFRAVIK